MFTHRSLILFNTEYTIIKNDIIKSHYTLWLLWIKIFSFHLSILQYDGMFNHMMWYHWDTYRIETRTNRVSEHKTNRYKSIRYTIPLPILRGAWIIYQPRSPIRTKIIRLTIQSTSIYPSMASLSDPAERDCRTACLIAAGSPFYESRQS